MGEPVQLRLSNGLQAYALSAELLPNGTVQTHLPQLAAGVYLLRIQSATSFQVRRIVVAK